MAPTAANAADLQVSTFKVSVVGTTVTYAATVCNKGSTTTKTFELELFYDRTTAPTCSSWSSKEFKINGLKANACVARSFTRTGVKAGSYVGWAFADGDCNVKETYENNNTKFASYAVGSVVKPDLYVHSFTAAVSGTTVTYTVYACNKGGATSSTFDIELYFNKTLAPGCSTSASYTWTQKGIGALKCVSKSYVRKNVSHGSYTGWARVDADCKVSESNEYNNNKSYKYSVISLPDLYVSSFFTKSSGSTVTYYTTVCNKGTTTTKTFDVELYYHRTSAPGCYTGANVQWKIYGGLAKGKCVVRTHTRTSTSNGTYTAWARADADCNVSELTETNNNKSYTYYVGALPDLYVSSFYGSVSGNTVTYTALICNKGSSTTKTFDVELYYNRTSAPGCWTIADYQWTVAGLGAKKCVVRTYKRTGVKAGKYLGWARVDADCKLSEIDETNNNKYDSYTVGSNKPDLYLTSFTTAVTGSSVTYKVTACNKGATTTKTFDIEIYYHSLTAPTCTTYYSYQWAIKGLPSGKCVSKTYTRKGAPSGSYLGWARVDADCTVAESYESNNNMYNKYTVGTSKPDLYVSSFTTAIAGTTVTYKVTACNKGATTSSSFDLEIYFHSTSTPGCTTTSSTEWSVPGLATKGCVSKSYVRKNVANGAYKGWARVDADCKVSESNESNNNKLRTYTVSSQKPDVYVKSLKAAVTGKNVAFTAEVCNKGQAITKGFDVALSYNLNSAPKCSSKSDHKWSLKGLAANSCTKLTHTRKSTPNGTYVGWVLADSGCGLTESNESNNAHSTVYKVALQPDTGVVLPDTGPPPDMPPPPQPDQFVEPDQSQPETDGAPPVEPDGQGPAPDQGTPDQPPPPTPDQGTGTDGTDDEGCSCDMQRAPRSGGNGAMLLLGLVLAFALLRRRR